MRFHGLPHQFENYDYCPDICNRKLLYWQSQAHRVADLRTRADAFREIRDTVSKLTETGFQDCHRI
jgi:hypothetical protein